MRLGKDLSRLGKDLGWASKFGFLLSYFNVEECFRNLSLFLYPANIKWETMILKTKCNTCKDKSYRLKEIVRGEKRIQDVNIVAYP